MSGLPGGLEQTFAVAAAELGMASAAWLFVEQVAAERGDAGVGELRDALGRAYPVLDAVAAGWLAGRRAPLLEVDPVVAACAGATDLVVVGLEATFLDALLPRLSGLRCALLCHSSFEADWSRVLSNLPANVEPVDLETFQRLAGPSSVLFTFAYGQQGGSTHVLPTWVRVLGEDVRTQFRSLIAWDVLRAPMFVYPRWLVEVSAAAFTRIV